MARGAHAEPSFQTSTGTCSLSLTVMAWCNLTDVTDGDEELIRIVDRQSRRGEVERPVGLLGS